MSSLSTVASESTTDPSTVASSPSKRLVWVLITCAFVAISVFYNLSMFDRVNFIQSISYDISYWSESSLSGMSITVGKQQQQQQRPTIAYAISLTNCDDPWGHNLFDGAAVLYHSIRMAHEPPNPSAFDFHTIAFVHPSAAEKCSSTLRAIGYEVQVRETPLELSDIQNPELQEAQGNGCCGIKEYLKLYSWILHDYPIVVHLDADCMVLKPMDSLFSLMLSSNHDQPSPLSFPTNHTQWVGKTSHHKIPETIGFAFTRDYNMVDPPHRQPHQIGVQGGFLVVKPNQTDFDRMIQIIKEGGGNYTIEDGWGGPTKQFGGYYGAGTIQGLASYYYGEYEFDRAIELNRCFYNSMVDDAYDTEQFDMKLVDKITCRTLEEECLDCRQVDVSNIYTNHFTVCGKPNWCDPLYVEDHLVNKTRPQIFDQADVCNSLQEKWHHIRREVETQWEIEFPDYLPGWIPPKADESDASNPNIVRMKIFHGHCHSPGNYIQMKFPEGLYNETGKTTSGVRQRR